LAKRTDLNQREIVQALRGVGAWVFPLHMVGHGFPDLLAIYRQRLYLLEVKSERGTLTPDELDWHLRHPGAAVVVRSIDEALRAIGAVEKERQQ
jgi:hypothetical protein